MEENNWLEKMADQQLMKQVMELNDITGTFGITITNEEALTLLDDRKYSLKEKQRVEFGEGILPQLIRAFCDSPYIYQDNFVEIIGRLQDIFYEYKNESIDALADDDLIAFMESEFNGSCQGSVDYLEETVLEEFARNIRVQGQNFLEHYYKVRDIEDE